MIISSIKAETSIYVLPHLNERYKNNKPDLKVVEGLARIHFLLCNMDLSVKYFKELVELNPTSVIDGGRLTYLACMNYPSGITQEDYFTEARKLGETFEKHSKFKETNYIFGNTATEDYLTKNYVNIDISNLKSKLSSTTKEYCRNIISKIENKLKLRVLEIILVIYFVQKILIGQYKTFLDYQLKLNFSKLLQIPYLD